MVGGQKQSPGSEDEFGVSYTGGKEASAVGREGQGEKCWDLSQKVTLTGQRVITVLHRVRLPEPGGRPEQGCSQDWQPWS